MTPADRLAEAVERVPKMLRVASDYILIHGDIEKNATGLGAIVLQNKAYEVEQAISAYRSAPAPLTVTEEDVEAVSERIYRSYTKYGYGFWYDMARAALDEFVKRKGGAS